MDGTRDFFCKFRHQNFIASAYKLKTNKLEMLMERNGIGIKIEFSPILVTCLYYFKSIDFDEFAFCENIVQKLL